MLLQPRLEKASPTLAAYAFNPGLSRQSSDELWPETHDAQPSRPSKRSRMKTDVDGESSADMQIKKRRLRRYLITSRLSKPYATPTTYINGRGAFRLVSCGRTTSLTRNLMMRVALLNAARQRGPFREAGMNSLPSVSEKDVKRDCEFRREHKNEPTSDCSHTNDVVSFIPLGLSNYEALDDSYTDDPWVDFEDETSVDHVARHGLIDNVAKLSKDPGFENTVLIDDPVIVAAASTWEFGADIFDS